MSSKFFRIIIIFFCTIILVSNIVFADKFPRIWNVGKENIYFVGRDTLLDQIHNEFSSHNYYILSITGTSGIGKSQLSKQYANKFKNEYDIIWWFDSSKNTEQHFIKLAKQWNQQFNTKIPISPNNEEMTISKIKNELRTCNLNWLLIFDNANDSQDLLNNIPEKHEVGKGHILITSNNNNIWKKNYKLESLERKESISLVKKIIAKDNLDQEKLNNLAAILDDYPLTLVQAATYIKSTSLDINQYINLYKNHYKTIINKQTSFLNSKNTNNIILDGYIDHTYTSISLIINELKEKSKDAYEILVLCSLLYNEKIPENLLLNYYHGSTKSEQELQISQALAYLNAFSLLEQVKPLASDLNENKLFNIHKLIQYVVINQLSNEEKKYYLTKVSELFNNSIPNEIDKYMPYITDRDHLIAHLYKINEHAEDLHFSNLAITKIKLKILEITLSGKRNFEKSEILLTKFEPFFNKKYADINSIVRFYFMKSCYYSQRSQLNSDNQIALLEAVKVQEMLKDTQGFYEEKLMIYNRIAHAYLNVGDITNAENYLKLAFEIISLSQKNKNFISNIDSFYQAKSRANILKGDYINAEKTVTIAFAETAKIRSTGNIAGTLPVNHIYSLILAENNKLEESLKIAQEGYDTCNKLFNSQHLFKLYFLNCLINVYTKMDKLQEAAYYVDVYKKESTTLSEHKLATMALFHLLEGNLLKKQRKYQEAIDKYLQSEKLYESFLTNKKIDYISKLYTNIAICSSMLNNDEITKKYLDLHKELFGLEHYGTKNIIQHLLDHNLNIPIT